MQSLPVPEHSLKILSVFLGAGLGGVLRYTSQLLVLGWNGQAWIATLLVNGLGSFLMGLLAGLVFMRSHLSPIWVVFWGAGFLGGFTTLSTFSLESLQFIQEQQWRSFFIYWGLSSLGCIAFCYLGFLFIRAVFA